MFIIILFLFNCDDVYDVCVRESSHVTSSLLDSAVLAIIFNGRSIKRGRNPTSALHNASLKSLLYNINCIYMAHFHYRRIVKVAF